jgi:hypothetical protein
LTRNERIPLLVWLCIAITIATITGIAPARADCPDPNSHPVLGDAKIVGNKTVIPCDCNEGLVLYGGRCVARRNADSICASQGGFVYYNNRCRARREAEDFLMNKIRNAAEGANRMLQAWVCEQVAALGSMLQSHVKTASGALFLMFATKSPDGILAEGVTLSIDTIELDVQTLKCATTKNVRSACDNFRVFMKTLKNARRELAYIHNLPRTSIGPAGPVIGPAPIRDASIWADVSDRNLDAFCQHPYRIQP